MHPLLTALIFILCLAVLPASAEPRPNLIFILADDLGFSDLGCYGSEIETPNLDALAASGLRFTQFYNCAKCETTRATLLTGRYHHEVGVGKLQNSVTLAEVARSAGYTTLMSGKWHMNGNPIDRGFDRYFGHLSGACNYFTGDNTFCLDKKLFEVPARGFYTTDAITDYAIQFVREAEADRPFFLYLAYNAPHYPLQAPREEVLKYRGQYRAGWDELRRLRVARQKQIGLFDKDYPLTPRPPDVPAWDSLSESEQDEQDLMMAAYAGMVDRMDQNIGRLVKTLRELGRLENTLILFLSDNGACPFQRTTPETRERRLMPWDPKSYWTYDKGWAHAGNTPFREYKRDQHEGGICTPCIAHWPKGLSARGAITAQPAHLVDLMATLVDLSGADYRGAQSGRSIGPMRGLSLRPVLEGKTRDGHEFLHFTFYGNHNALRRGAWKLVNKDNGPWELYHLAEDRTELNNLAPSRPDLLGELQSLWSNMAREIGVSARGQRR